MSQSRRVIGGLIRSDFITPKIDFHALVTMTRPEVQYDSVCMSESLARRQFRKRYSRCEDINLMISIAFHHKRATQDLLNRTRPCT